MGGNGQVTVDGVGQLNYQRAIDIARNTEGELDSNVKQYLEDAIATIWSNIQAQPETYVLTKDEFPVFNYYRKRFDDDPIAEQAVDRYWRNTEQQPSSSRRR